MNSRTHAVRVGLARGWTEFSQSVKSAQDQGFYLFTAVAVLTYLLIRRNTEVEGTSLLYPSVAMPSILGALVAFGVVIGPAYALAMEREDGTLLRAKAVPNGLLSGGAEGWLTVVWVLVLGLLAALPIGMIIGSLVPSTQKVGTWGMLPIMVLSGISGIFYPVQQLWGWVQVIAQVFPMYWLGLGMRSAFLPDSAAALEITESWRTLETVAVLGTWAVLGLLLTPVVLRRMARRQSGSQVEAARQAAVQWVR